MPAKRRQLRQAVVQYLYFWEVTRPAEGELERSMQLIWEAFEIPADGRDFSEGLIIGTLQNLPKIDATIKEKLENWDFGRLHKVDLTILRLALYEFYFRPDIPPVVTINEAIDLAKDFSGEESGKFINGILDKIAPTLGRPLREAVK
jgi:transcription antitermination protein NusB